MRQRIRNAWKENTEIRFFILFIGIFCVYHLLMREYAGDAVRFFAKALDEQTMAEYLRARYEVWTSRVLIEIPLVLVARHFTVWKLLNLLVILILYQSFQKLTGHRACGLVFLLMLLYPVSQMGSAGWIATSINYLWPLAFGAAASLSLLRIREEQRIHPLLIPVYILCELFAANFESFAVVYLILILLTVGSMLYDGRKITAQAWGILAAETAVIAGSLVFILTCPGNWNRQQKEIASMMPEFAGYTAADKLALGVTDTCFRLTERNILFFCFAVCLLLFALYSRNRKSVPAKGMAAVPAAFVLLRTILLPLSAAWFPDMTTVFDNMFRINATNYYIPSSYMPFLLYLVLIACIELSFLNLFTLRQALELMTVFTAGLLTRLVMGFSPTLLASHDRTFLFLDFAMIYCIVRMYTFRLQENAFEGHIRLVNCLKYMLVILAVLSVLGNLAGISTRY